VNTPAIPAGQSVTVNQSFAISSVAAGIYYLWVSLDNTNITNQSDGTNDYAHSQALTVSATGTTGPQIVSFTGNQTIQFGQSAIFTVRVNGTPPFTYNWRHDGHLMDFTSTTSSSAEASLRVTAAGNYAVDVISGGVTGSSSPSTLTVTGSTSFIPGPAETGALLAVRQVGTQAPTIVITHGWQPSFSSTNWGTPPPWMQTMADDLTNATVHPELAGVNVFLYLWKAAYSPLPGQPYGATKFQGKDLAWQLRLALGDDYDTTRYPIHFVGHSFGTFVNAFAIANVPWHVTQVTTLDPPINPVVYIGVVPTDPFALFGLPLTEIFYRNLPATKIDYLDNYIAGKVYDLPISYPAWVPVTLGHYLPGAAPNGGRWLPLLDHGTITTDFYVPSIEGSVVGGFQHSVLLHSGKSDLAVWNPPPSLSQSLGDATQAAANTVGNVVNGVDNVFGTARNILRFFKSGGQNSRVGSAATAAGQPGDSKVDFDVQVPAEATALKFNFLFSQVGNGDWMTVTFNDQVVYTFTGTGFHSTDYDEAYIPVANIAGQCGVFTITLHSASDVATELRVANLHFESPSPATLISPPARAAISFPQTFTWSLSDNSSAKVYIAASPNARPGIDPIAVSSEIFSGSGSLALSDTRWANVVAYLGVTGTYYWTVGDANLETGIFADWRPIISVPTEMGNISTRLNVGAGDNAMIGGFIITGTEPKTVIIRGIGPSLANFGLSGVMADPILELHDSSQVITANDDWQTNANKQEIIGSNLAPKDPKEAAILTTLNPGNYTAVLRGANNGPGIGTVEVYDLDQTVDSKLANISTRGFVNTGDNVMIGGTIITGTASANVLIRAIGPSLTNFGVPNALQNPTLELHDAQGGIIASNDDWINSPDAAAISATTLQPTDNRESAILANLQPGGYTAVVRGAGNTTGVALVEAYQLQ
jgi:pimeloyl-ACP methyl ester carboxylesterase